MTGLQHTLSCALRGQTANSNAHWEELDHKTSFICFKTLKWITSLCLKFSKKESFIIKMHTILQWLVIHTVSPTHSRSIAHLWYDLGVLWLSIICLKSAAKCLFSIFPNKYRSDLSKKLVFDPTGQRASKLQTIKVCAGRDSNPGP